jgi:DNA-binding XRE family transcriptional regulator
MIRGPVQFLLDASGRPQYAVLTIEDYWAITGDGGQDGADRAAEPKDPLGRDAPPFDVPPEVEQAVAHGLHPIAAWRSYRGLTQEILAGWIGFEESDIAYFEENDAVPTVEILQMIANALNVPIQALLPPREG